MNTKIFECKEDGCKEKVVYKKQQVPGAIQLTILGSDNENGHSEDNIYLTCNAGHVHSYTVQK